MVILTGSPFIASCLASSVLMLVWKLAVKDTWSGPAPLPEVLSLGSLGIILYSVDCLSADSPVSARALQMPMCPGAASITMRFQITSPPYQYEIQRMT
jgi:hypothetical protein